MKPIWKICLATLLLTAVCHGSEDWTITKDSGAYRVNDCKLMADGRLVSASGATRVLTRQQLDEIGAAIDRYESVHVSPLYASPTNASPAMAGPSKNPVPTTLISPRDVMSETREEEAAQLARLAGWQPRYMRDVLILVLFAFSLGGLSLKPPAIKTVSALLIIVILGYWIIVYVIPIILTAIFLVLLGPLAMLSRLRKK